MSQAIISRQVMLAEMMQSEGKPFLLKFISAEDGRLCIIERAVYGGEKREANSRSINKNGDARKVVSMKETGKLPLTNLDSGEGRGFRTPYISHIIQYNHYRVRH